MNDFAFYQKRNEMHQSIPSGLSRLYTYVLFAGLALLIVGLQSSHVFKQSYAVNEDWSVYGSSASLTISPQLNHIVTTDYPLLDIWVNLFGSTPSITRYLSTLLNILCFAALFRLCADLFNRKTAFTALMLLGTLTLVQEISWQAQPFAALLMIVPTLLLLGLRWLHNATLRTACLYLGFAIAAIYICTFSILLVVAQAVFFLIFVPRNRLRDRQVLLLFAVITVFALPHWITFANINHQSGLPFASWFALDLLNIPISVSPLELTQVILLLALAVIAIALNDKQPQPHKIRLQWNANWQVSYPVTIIILFIMMLAFIPNLPAGSLYSIGIIPIVVVLAAHAIGSLGRVLQALVLIVFVGLSFTVFRSLIPVKPYQDIAAETMLSASDKLVIVAPYIWEHLPLMHYAVGQGDERIFHIMQAEEADRGDSTVIPPEYTAHQADALSIERFNQFVDHAPTIWFYIENGTGDKPDDFAALLSNGYDEINPATQLANDDQRPTYGELHKYIQIPADLQTIFMFGDQLALRAWQLQQSVTVSPCESITVQSWWGTDTPILDNLSMTLVLTNPADGQGLAHADSVPTGRDITSLPTDHARVDEHTLQIPCDIQPGEYPLLIGVYAFSGDTINPLPVTLSDGSPQGNFAYLTTLFVNP